MGQKLHRGRRRYSRRRTAWKPILGWLLAAAILIPGTYMVAKLLSNDNSSLPVSKPGETTNAMGIGNSSAATQTTTVPTTAPPTVPDSYCGFVLPYTALRDTAALSATCKSAAAAGFNCAVIELKNEKGNVYYRSATEIGLQAAAATEDALSLDAVNAAFTVMRTEGVLPIAKLFAFKDAVAPRSLPGAKVLAAGHADWTWYDGDPANGGKPWLNPYSETAQQYIAALSEELYDAGAASVMLDGVCFPTQTAQADFTSGNSNAALTKAAVLTQFVTRINALSDAPLFFSCSANAALGNTTAGYERNPMTFGMDAIAVDMRSSALGDGVRVSGERLAVTADSLPDTVCRVVNSLPAGGSIAVLPLLDADTAPMVIAALKTQSADASYLVAGNGNYDFSAF